MKTVQLKVNEENLVKNLRHAFVDQEVFIAELMQNARRAGATYIEFCYDENTHTLEVADDGRGLKNPQDILTIAQSGWSDDIQQHESPFGMGFMSALYQASYVTIRSNGSKIEFHCNDALGFSPIPVVTVESQPGTKITLKGVPELEYKEIVTWYARGFPINVYWADELLPRPDALDQRSDWIHTDIGSVVLSEWTAIPNSANHALGSSLSSLYLQGIPIGRTRVSSYRLSQNRNVIHLDTKRFHGRMPDRSHLQNAKEEEAVIDDRIRELWKSNLSTRLRLVPEQDIAEKWYDTLKKWDRMDILNNLSYLPPAVVEYWSDYPMLAQDWEIQKVTGSCIIKRSDLENRKVTLVEETDNDQSWVAAMYTYEKELPILDQQLDAGHWVYSYTTELSSEDIHVTVSGHIQDAEYNGNYIYGFPVIFAETVVLEGPAGIVEVERAFVLDNHFLSVNGRVIWIDQPYIIVPFSESDGNVVRQLEDFSSDCQFNEDLTEREIEEFSRFILATREGRDIDLLYRIFDDLRLSSYPVLNGKVFRLEVDGRGIRLGGVSSTAQLPSRSTPRLYFMDETAQRIRIYEYDAKKRFTEVRHINVASDALQDLVEAMLSNLPRGHLAKRETVRELVTLLERNPTVRVFSHHEIDNFLQRAIGYPLDTGRDPVYCQYRYPDKALSSWTLSPVALCDEGVMEPIDIDEEPFCWTVYQVQDDGTVSAVIDVDTETLATALCDRLIAIGTSI